MRSASFEGLRQHLFRHLQSEGVIDSIRATHDASLLPTALHLAPVDPATVRKILRVRTSDAPYQHIQPCYSLTSTPSQAKPWTRAWSTIDAAAKPPAHHAYKASEILPPSCDDPNRRFMLIGLGIRSGFRHDAHPPGSPPVPRLCRRC